jgi:hypothetical protein
MVQEVVGATLGISTASLPVLLDREEGA